MKKSKIERLVIISVLISFSAVLSLIDRYISNAFFSLMPFIGVVVPNFKIGLANIIILIIIINYDFKTGLISVILKVVLVGLFNPGGFIMSFGGSMLSFLVMSLLFKLLKPKKMICFISSVGGFTHSFGQLLFGLLYYGLLDIKNTIINHQLDLNILIYAPCILIAGAITGMVIGFIAKTLNNYLEKITIISNKEENKNMKTIYVAHRGSRVEGGVENTVDAFLGGVKAGAKALECDVRVTKDNTFIIFHDNDLTRLTSGSPIQYTLDVNNENYENLKSIVLTQTYQNQTYHGNVCLFEDYLKICKDNDIIPIIELKWTNGIYSDNQNEENYNFDNLDKIVDMIKKYDLFDKAYVMTSMRGCLSYLRKKYHKIKLQWLCSTNVLDYLDWAINNNINIDVEHNSVSKEIVDKCHQNNLLVNIWTMNDETLLEKYLKMGVDMITSDYVIRK